MKTQRVCKKGHTYFKSTDCPTCPTCEALKKPSNGFQLVLSAPARRALENNNIGTLEDLLKWSERDLLTLHGMGPSSIPKLKAALKEKGLQFKS